MSVRTHFNGSKIELHLHIRNSTYPRMPLPFINGFVEINKKCTQQNKIIIQMQVLYQLFIALPRIEYVSSVLLYELWRKWYYFPGIFFPLSCKPYCSYICILFLLMYSKFKCSKTGTTACKNVKISAGVKTGWSAVTFLPRTHHLIFITSFCCALVIKRTNMTLKRTLMTWSKWQVTRVRSSRTTTAKPSRK